MKLGTFVSRKAIIFALAVCGGEVLPSSAGAQNALPQGELRAAPDEKGVDLITQKPEVTDPGISIGEPDQGGISFIRKWSGTGSLIGWGWNHNFNFNAGAAPWPPANGTVVTYRVTIGFKAFDFVSLIDQTTHIAGPWNSVHADGTTFTNGLNGYTFTDRDGTVVSFSNVANGSFPTRLVKPNGETWTFAYQYLPITYPPYGNAWYLQDVSTNFGYEVHFNYNPAASVNQYTGFSGSISLINSAVDYCAPLAASCASLSNSWPKESYYQPRSQTPFTETDTNPVGATRTYNIDNKLYNLTGFRPGSSGTNTINYSYIANIQYATVTSARDDTGSWSYSSSPESVYSFTYGGTFYYSAYDVTRTDPNGKIVRARDLVNINLEPVLGAYTDELGRTTRYIYDGSGRLTHVVEPEGSIDASGIALSGYTQNGYDSRGNVIQVVKVAKAGSGLANLVYTASYPSTCTNPKTCNKPTWIRDANGNQTDYTYDGNHGGLLSEMKPAPAAGAARPLTLRTFAQRSAWVKNSAGALVQSPNPIWLLSTETTCQTVGGSNAATCDSSAMQTTKTYLYGAAGSNQSLLIKGVSVSSGGTTLVTCYGYDIYNRKISETKPNANLTTCS